MKKGPQNGELPSRRAEAVRLDASIILNRERLRQGLVAWGFNGRLHNYGVKVQKNEEEFQVNGTIEMRMVFML